MNLQPTPPLVAVPCRFAQIAGIASIVVGCAALVGWMCDVVALKSIVPNAVTMKANTALGFILSGASLFLLQMPRVWARGAARVCALGAGGIAVLTLFQYATGRDLKIDELLFHDTGAKVGTSHPGRPGQNTALCFALTAAALWVMSGRAGNVRRPLILSWLGSFVAAIGLFGMFGYLAGSTIGYGWWSLTGMAIHTAALFVLLGAAVLIFAWREAQMRWMIGRLLTFGFTAALALLVAVAAYSHRSTAELLEADEWVNHTHEVLAQICELRSHHDEEQSGRRGFVITGDDAFLPLADHAIPEARKDLSELRNLTVDNASQQARLDVLEKLFDERLKFSEQVIELRRTRGFEAAAQQIGTRRGKELSDQIRVAVRKMEAEERRLLALRTAEARATTDRAIAIPPIGAVLSLILLMSGLIRLNAAMAARARDSEALRESEKEIREWNASLEERVRARTAQLEAAVKELEGFSYSVSHDLRAPLRHIHGYVEMLTRSLEGQLGEKPRRYLQTITAASVEMGQLIDDLLAFSRTSRAGMRATHVALDGLVTEAIRGLEMAVQGRNIEWKIAPLPAVVGDPAMLRQVLANLICNAVKYTRPRDPAHIEIGVDGAEDGRTIFFVRDNGVGFDMQYAHKLFGVFQRLHRADEFEGTGIGLATVRRVISRHGGRTWAEGKLGEGATFYFTLKPAVAS